MTVACRSRRSPRDDAQRELERLRREIERSRQEADRLREENARLQRERDRLQREIERLTRALDAGRGVDRPAQQAARALAGKISTLLRDWFGLPVRPSGVTQALHRAARCAAPTYDALSAQVRGSPVVSPDETSWKVAGQLRWLWVFATTRTVVYAIHAGRGFSEAAAILGADFEGALVRDGWAPYRQFTQAAHQTCLAHLIRRCREIADTHPRTAWPRRVQAVLQEALAVRDRLRAGELSTHGAAVARGHLIARLANLVAAPGAVPDCQRLAGHLTTEFTAVLSFLFDDRLDATNWRAEQAIRPAVVNRKVSGGNRSSRGAETQQVLSSVIQTFARRAWSVGRRPSTFGLRTSDASFNLNPRTSNENPELRTSNLEREPGTRHPEPRTAHLTSPHLSPLQHPPDLHHQRTRRAGLRHEPVAPGTGGALQFARSVMRGERHDRDVRGPGVALQAARRLPAVDHGQAQVHQHDVRRLVGGVDDGLGAVGGLDDVEPAERQVLDVELPEVGLVLHDENQGAVAIRRQLVHPRHRP
jgi:hypothetical protein